MGGPAQVIRLGDVVEQLEVDAALCERACELPVGLDPGDAGIPDEVGGGEVMPDQGDDARDEPARGAHLQEEPPGGLASHLAVLARDDALLELLCGPGLAEVVAQQARLVLGEFGVPDSAEQVVAFDEFADEWFDSHRFNIYRVGTVHGTPLGSWLARVGVRAPESKPLHRASMSSGLMAGRYVSKFRSRRSDSSEANECVAGARETP